MSNNPDNSKIKISYNKSKSVNYLFDLVKNIIFVFIIVMLLFIFVFRDAKVVGNSMLDTLHQDDRILLTNVMYEPHNNDIVVIYKENLADKRIIKRVIAKEGQTLQIDYNTGSVYVDGIKLDEPYISSATKQATHPLDIPYVIPEGYIFVMGDNRSGSLDSRDTSIGLVPIDDVIGKAELVLYPFDRIKYLY